MDKEEAKHVIIIGDKTAIETCLRTMTETDHDIQDMTTFLQLSITTHAAPYDSPMANLKGDDHDMECDNSLDLSKPTCSTKRSFESSPNSSPKMKQLKSLDRIDAHSDVGYESDPTESDENKEMSINICAMVLEDDTGLNRKLASFAFSKLNIWPALILLPIYSESFSLDLYVDVLTELGMYASGTKAVSKLMVVRMSSHNEETQRHISNHKVCLHMNLLDSYFGRNFDFCESNNLLDKVKKFLNANCAGTHLFESVMSEGTEENKVVNIFQSMLTELLKLQSAQCTMKNFFNHMETLVIDSKRHSFIESLGKLSLLHKTRDNKMITLIPLVYPDCLPKFEQAKYEVDTNPLLMVASIDKISAYLRANIIKIILEKDWSVHSSGPKSCKKDSIVFSKESQGIVIQFESSNQKTSAIYLYGLTAGESTDSCSSEEYQNLRECIENELKVYSRRMKIKENSVKLHVKLKSNQNLGNVLTTDEGEWIEVNVGNPDQKIVRNLKGYLTPWFASEIKQIERQLKQGTSDVVLSDISNLFGKGHFMFFVSQGVPRETLDRIDMENPKSIKDAVYKMLLEWKKCKGNDANLVELRSALEESTHVIVDINKFDDIVTKHNKKQ
ncbi:uncharacterized protein LOC132738468 [Ruditapes philippinarum]|uniref:uncharacterized protein LOC132738468 n=1 Tax=Ruditapes philippinarum TaxID=129788 RepID=UPI00295A6AB6|nr:uncharacterized protein LOC132738468 [Ruditapes philippinarum]